MMNFLKKWLYKDIRITEYCGIMITDNSYERVFLVSGNEQKEISSTHWVLCLEPLIFGIWIKKEERFAIDPKRNLQIIFRDPEKIIAKAELSLFDKIEDDDGTLILLRYIKGKLLHLHPLETISLFSRYFRRTSVSFERFKLLVTAFSYPRKVRIISFRDEEHLNIFPMDLLGSLNGSNRFVFGLRHTNQTLSRIIAAGKIVVSEVSFEHKEDIYKLGKHHGTNPETLPHLSFPTFPSKNFGFPVPVWARSYREIRIKKTMNLGSQMLMWGEIIHEEKISEPLPGFYHIHFLLYLHQQRRGHHYKLA